VQSMMRNNNMMCADKAIKFDAAESVLKYGVGDEIKLNEAHFILLSSAFFTEIESRYL